MSVLVCAGALVFADVAGTLDASNRTEMRVRHTAGVTPDPGIDLVDVPSARIGMRDHRWNYTLGYTATAVAPDLEAQVLPQLFQAADVGIAWHDRRVRLGLTETASYGAQNPGFLLTQAPAAPAPAGQAPGATGPTTPPPANTPPGVQALAAPATIFSGSSTTALTAQLEMTRRWSANTALAYSLQGGLDASSRASLPFLKGPRADALVSFAATRLDALDTRLSGQRGDTTSSPCSPVIVTASIKPGDACAPSAETAQITESWRRQITHATQAWLGGGASAVRVRLNEDASYVGRIYPVVVAGVLHERVVEDLRTQIRLDALLGPMLDVRTGIIDQRANGTLTLTLPMGRVTLVGSLGGTRSISSPFVQPVTVVQTTAEVDYRFARYLTFGAGARYAWQDQEGLGSFTGSAGFVLATFHAPQMKF